MSYVSCWCKLSNWWHHYLDALVCRSLILRNSTICWKQQRTMPRRVTWWKRTFPVTSSASWGWQETLLKVLEGDNNLLQLTNLTYHKMNNLAANPHISLSSEMVNLDSYDSEGPLTPETDDSTEVRSKITSRLLISFILGSSPDSFPLYYFCLISHSVLPKSFLLLLKNAANVLACMLLCNLAHFSSSL